MSCGNVMRNSSLSGDVLLDNVPSKIMCRSDNVAKQTFHAVVSTCWAACSAANVA